MSEDIIGFMILCIILFLLPIILLAIIEDIKNRFKDNK